MIMDRLYGGVCYAGIDTDPELKYPKGAGRVAFSNQQSYIAAISARFVQLQHGEIDKRVGIQNPKYDLMMYLFIGRSKTLCSRWPAVWRMSRWPMWWKVCTVLLRKCHMSSGKTCYSFLVYNIPWVYIWGAALHFGLKMALNCQLLLSFPSTYM